MFVLQKHLEYVFEDIIETSEHNRKSILKKHELGILHLKTGKIVATDPFVFEETKEFTVSVKPGDYPVSIFVSHTEDDKRIALVELKFSEKRAVRWEMALVEGQCPTQLLNSEYFGYYVDSGTGSFMDKAVIEEIKKGKEHPAEEFHDRFNELLEASYTPTYNNILASISEDTHNDIVAFSTGCGDGHYPSYFGYDVNNEPCVLVTDFLILGD